MTDRKCATCRHSQMSVDGRHCHRYPPTLVPTMVWHNDRGGIGEAGSLNIDIEGMWPPVSDDDVCGEWTAMEDT